MKKKAGVDFGSTNVKAHWIKPSGEKMHLSTADVSRKSLVQVLQHEGVTDIVAAGVGSTSGFEAFAHHRALDNPHLAELRLQALGARKLIESMDHVPLADTYMLVSIGTGMSFTLCDGVDRFTPFLGSAIGAKTLDALCGTIGGCKAIDTRLSSEELRKKSDDLMLVEAVPAVRGTHYEHFVAAHFYKTKVPHRKKSSGYFVSAVNMLVTHVAQMLLLHDQNPKCRMQLDGFDLLVQDVVILGMLPARSHVFRSKLEDMLAKTQKRMILPPHAEYALAVGAYHAVDIDP